MPHFALLNRGRKCYGKSISAQYDLGAYLGDDLGQYLGGQTNPIELPPRGSELVKHAVLHKKSDSASFEATANASV